MSVRERGGRWVVKVYDPTCAGNQRWVGTYPTEEIARSVEADARNSPRGRPRALRVPGVLTAWALESKRETDCRSCGKPAENLHHIVPKSFAPDEMRINNPHVNGMPLCVECHRGWHHRTVRIPTSRLRPEEQAFALMVMGDRWLDRAYGGESPLAEPSLKDGLLDEVVALRMENERLNALLGGAR